MNQRMIASAARLMVAIGCVIHQGCLAETEEQVPTETATEGQSSAAPPSWDPGGKRPPPVGPVFNLSGDQASTATATEGRSSVPSDTQAEFAVRPRPPVGPIIGLSADAERH